MRNLRAYGIDQDLRVRGFEAVVKEDHQIVAAFARIDWAAEWAAEQSERPAPSLAPWVRLKTENPSELRAVCERCGAVLTATLPLDLEVTGQICGAFALAHRGCRESA